MKKLFFGLMIGVSMLLINLLSGAIFSFIAPGIQTEYANQNIFRPYNDPLMLLMFVHPFVVGLILTYLWSWVKDIIPGDSVFIKGIKFGLIFCLVSLPGMLISYGSFQLSFVLVLSWSFGILGQSLIAGIILSRLIK